MCYSFYFSLFNLLLFRFFLSSPDLLLIKGKFGCFLVDADLFPLPLVYFFYFGYYFFIISFDYYFFFPFTAELFGRGGTFFYGTELLF
jgi:hypothetical protein